MLFVGDDWAEDHHDLYLQHQQLGCDSLHERASAAGSGGRLVAELASRRLPEGLAGIRLLHDLIAAHADDPAQVAVGIETDRGLWVEALTGAGYQVYAVNPLAVARYRDRHAVSGAKSDAADAKLLADLVRTDRHNHRLIAGDTPEADASALRASALRDRTQCS